MPADKDHLILPVGHIDAKAFSPKQGGGGRSNIPNRPNRRTHADNLKRQLEELQRASEDNVVITIKFKGAIGNDLLFEDLNKSRFHMELLSIREAEGVVSANVRINSGTTFNQLYAVLEKYVTPTPRRNRCGELRVPENPMPYIASIERIEQVSVDDFFTDDASLLPADNDTHWWEVWLTNNTANGTDVICNTFVTAARAANIIINERQLPFEDRLVFLCEATKSELSAFIPNCNLIAEIRLAKLLKKPLLHQPQEQQQTVLDDLQRKTIYPDNDNTRIVVLDGNYIARHPLLDAVLVRNQQADARFSLDNTNEHATEMGGLTLFGDLQIAATLPSIILRHKIEGVQLFDHIINNPEFYGIITENAVGITIGENVNNAYVMPVTEDMGDKHKGKPSSWSAYMDKLSFERQKLFAVSVGNMRGIIGVPNYEQEQKNASVESPSQAWNILSVGSYTELCDATLGGVMGVVPFANPGEISPHSRTSCLFESQWPIKPEVLFEGGNKVVEADGNVVAHDAFDLVTCAKNFRVQPFTSINGTSASTGLAGQFMGELMAKYPDFWPETIRGLVVHSAEWTEAMLAKLPANHGKTERAELSHIFGYGVPNLEKAKYSASNALTLISQKSLQVFKQKLDDNNVPTKGKISQILTFPLPWPDDVLQNELRDAKIKLKITLSYFIKPNPSERGYKNKYAYQSHNLRFDLQRPAESLEQFKARINSLIQIEESEASRQDDGLDWFYGTRARSRGSIHKDTLEIKGADLATMRNIAIYSVAGWWKNRATIPAKDTLSRFSLIIDIDAGETDIDLYTRIQNLIPIIIANPA